MSTPSPAEVRAWLESFVRAPHFLERYPFYAAVLARLSPVADPSVSRMAVELRNGRFYLRVNVESFVREPQFTTGVLLHEVHHVVLGHLSHPKFRDVAHPDLMDLCVEMSANEYVEEPLPDPIVCKQFERYGVRAGQSTMERYELLAALRREGGLGATPAPRHVDDHANWQTAPTPPGAAEQTRALLRDAIENSGHEIPVPVPKRMRLAGKDPGRLLESLTGVLAPPEHPVDWKTALAMFAVRSRAPTHTYTRPSRRFPNRVGEIPGRAWTPRSTRPPHLLVAIDTSSSITHDELAEVARQLGTMVDHARITVAECDVEVRRLYPFDGAVADVSGRGGTDLRAPFAPDVLASVRPDGVVYFTDGEGPLPDERPRVPVLWVLVRDEAAKDFACPWGERVAMR